MTDSLDRLRQQIDQCTDGERRILFDYLKAKVPRHPLEEEWGVNAEIILTAISRSSDLTKRGVRGIIAEAVFERRVLGNLKGWTAVKFVEDKPYDFLLRSDYQNPREARIQAKLQRLLNHHPLFAFMPNRPSPKNIPL